MWIIIVMMPRDLRNIFNVVMSLLVAKRVEIGQASVDKKIVGKSNKVCVKIHRLFFLWMK